MKRRMAKLEKTDLLGDLLLDDKIRVAAEDVRKRLNSVPLHQYAAEMQKLTTFELECLCWSHEAETGIEWHKVPSATLNQIVSGDCDVTPEEFRERYEAKGGTRGSEYHRMRKFLFPI